MENYSDFGVKARAVMLQKGITISALAKELGICTMYLGEILRGTRGKRKGQEYRDRISKILGIKG
jgi:transcriptional regulator with XRE-family HTH domain